MSPRLFVLCALACGKTGWEMFSLDGKVDYVFVSKLPNLSTCTVVGWGGIFSESMGNSLLPVEMLLGGEERPHVVALGFSFSRELALGSS